MNDTDLLEATKAAVAPGTELRDGLERILRGNTGALIVLGDDKTVQSISTGGFELDIPFSATRMRELAKMDGAIILDAGSTMARFAALLSPSSQLTIFTDSAPVATSASTHSTCDVQLIGGRVRPTTQATVGNVEQFDRLRVEVAFLGTNGISVDHGLSTPDVDEAATKAAMVRCAREVVVLADSRKIGAESTTRFATLDDIDVLITDEGISEHQLKALKKAGVDVVIV